MRMTHAIRLLLFALFLLSISSASFPQVSIGISVGYPPPPLPVYEQPICPSEGYIWTPGYWAWDPDDEDYFWVPGTWVVAPEVGYLWTPAWWGWGDGGYAFHEGYWGPSVGFYGGVVYGFGYFGHGYEGGRWDHDRFFYNTTVNNINVTQIHNTYNTTIINNNTTINRVSYNGGNGGINARPTRQEEDFARERHVPPVSAQTRHVQEARGNRELRASVNHGKPAVAATPRPGEFKDRGAVAAREAGGRYEPPPNRGGNVNAAHPAVHPNDRPPGVHPSDRPPHDRLPAPNSGNPQLDQKYQQQQEKLYAKQNQDHQRLQQKQEQEHQRLVQQQASDARRQQVEQQHQQQTQRMEDRHVQQLQKMQQKQQPPRQSPPPRGRP